MCGRTIRVPNLDGSVEALPDPKLNLQDAGLKQALASLASLDADEAEGAAPPAGADAAAPDVLPAKKPAPEVIQPAIVAAPPVVELAISPPSTPALEPAADSTPANPKSNPLQELAEAPPSLAPSRKPTVRSSKGPGGALLIGAVLLSFGAGLALGYFSRSQTAAQAVSELEDVPNIPQPKVPVPAGNTPAIPQPSAGATVEGTLKYVAPNGQSLNDSEARVLVFPIKHPGQVKLPVQGFRSGANPADQLVAIASLAALGGEYAIADKGGRYALHVPPGEYHLLLVSRYSPRDENVQLIDPVRNLTDVYFDRPQQLVGQVNYHYVRLELGDQPQTLDHEFSGL
ncbi:MAG: hypothetical protein KDA58_07000 [Planctomycetaceae bacterium]|nr:hypothetical protein [Planctomycetaceae bacterium]